ncbi:MAG: hypothetical protein RL488_611 [Actinomycetota bacterium]
MRLRQSPMVEASALMGITLILFLIGLWIIQGDLTKVLSNGPILSALLLFPSYVLWLVFGRVTRDAKISTRFLTALGVVLAVAAFGALLMQPPADAENQQKAIIVIAQIVIDFAVSGLVAASVTYGFLIRESKQPDPTLLTKPLVPAQRKKRK